MSRFPYSPVLLRLGNTLGSWSSQVGSPRENRLDRNWVALPHENPLVQEPPLHDICNPVTFRQSCVKCYAGKVPFPAPKYLWDHKNKQKKHFWTEISTHLLKKARWVFTHVIWLLHGSIPCDLIFLLSTPNGQ
jgi:hypothetical protein